MNFTSTFAVDLDVSLSSGGVLQYNGSEWETSIMGSAMLSSDSNALLSTSVNGQLLQHNTPLNKWNNTAAPYMSSCTINTFIEVTSLATNKLLMHTGSMERTVLSIHLPKKKVFVGMVQIRLMSLLWQVQNQISPLCTLQAEF